LRNLQQYNKIVLQRNHLLRMIKEQRSNPDELRFWDEQLVESGSYLIAQRQSCVNSINTKAVEIHKQLTTGTEDLETIYVRSVAQQPDQDISGAFLEELQNARGEEIARGMSTVGPHRDDLRLLVGGVNMCIYGSRGQHRTIALSLKLAQAKYIESLAGDTPILLLDDVLSELDSERRRRLLNAVENYEQAIITSTDWDHFDANFLSRATKFKISQGNLGNT
jgi:DNA replication and repair protein RecF